MRPPRGRAGRSPLASAAATARTSQPLTDSRSRPAASSTPALSCSGRRRLMRAIAPSSPSGGASGGGLGGLGGRSLRGHELRLARAQAQVDRGGRELAGDLVRRRRQRLEQRQPDGGLQRGGEPFGQRARLGAARLTGDRELAAEVLDERREVHGASMASLWHHVNARLADDPARVDFPAA